MRLHRLTLRDVKGVRERSVDFPDHGVVVVEGPNEVGKTTMIEAFDALLAFKASSKAGGVRALKPVDRDVGPFVEAEFTIGGTRVRYAKQWLRQPATTLHVLGPRPEQLTGDLAQQRVDSLLDVHLDRTLWDALRLTQAGDGTLGALSSSTVLTEALDAAAGAHQHADGADALLDAVRSEYSTYFTATGRPTGEYRAALGRHTEAEHAVAEAHRRVVEGAALLGRLDAARARRSLAEQALAGSVQTLGDAEEAWAQAELVAEAHVAALERCDQAEQLHRAATAAAAQRARDVAEIETLQAEVDRAAAERETAAQEAEGLTSAYVRAREHAERAATATERAETDVEECRGRWQLVADATELARRQALLARVTELSEALSVARGAVPAPAVGREAVRRARRLHDSLTELRRQHDATSPVLHVESLGATTTVRRDDTTGPHTVGPSAVDRVVLTHDTVVEVPGQVRLRVQLQDEAHVRTARIGELHAELAALLQEHRADDLASLERAAEATEVAQETVRQMTRDLLAALAPHGAAVASRAVEDGVVPEALSEDVAEAQQRVEQAMDAAGGGSDLPTDSSTARRVVDEALARHRTARAAQRSAEQALADAGQAVTALTSRLDRAEGHIQAQTARLAALRAQLETERKVVPDDDLAVQVRDAAERAETAAVALAEAERAVAAADVDGARSRVEEARLLHRRAVSGREAALAELHSVTGQVEMVAGEGREELHDLALLDLQEARRALAAVDRRARAARHLHTTLVRHRDAAHRAYVQPYTEALEALGRQVYGPGFAVTVDEQLGLTSRTLDGVTVDFAELSGGAKEQLGILARLAVARLVDPTQGVPVVIDDALGYSDPRRLRQMGEVLGSAGVAEGMQVILLTCTPERYSSVPEVRTVRLTA